MNHLVDAVNRFVDIHVRVHSLEYRRVYVGESYQTLFRVYGDYGLEIW